MNTTLSPKHTIMIIDDDRALRRSIAAYLEDSGFKILQEENGKEGLLSLRTNRPDVILLDLRMPGMDGIEFLKHMQKDDPDLPIIVVSGAGALKDAISSLRLGAFDYITKPVLDMGILDNAIKKAIERTQLIVENRKYRKHLESEIEIRTAKLAERTKALENANRDLTQEMAEHQKTAEALFRSKSRLNEIIQVFDGFIYTCNREQCITFMNKKMIKHIGRDATNENCFRAFYGRETPCTFCPSEAVFAGKTIRSENKNPLDNRWYFSMYTPIFSESGEVEQYEVMAIDITDRKMAEEALRKSEAHLREENKRLRSSLTGTGQFGPLIGKSSAMQEVYDIILKASLSTANIIIYGESGTGKELVAKTIHDLSHRKHKKLLTVNCGAIPDNLIESEFFGYKKGAFTGATEDKKGFLESAEGGTLFLDEVGEIPQNLQVKLLRAISGDGYTPIGSRDVILPNIRFIAATNKDLRVLIEQGKIREDFYYRLHIIPVFLPPLRERREDIPLLIHHFIKKYAKEDTMPQIPVHVMRALQHHDWRGNIRELENTIQRFVTLDEIDINSTAPVPAIENEKTKFLEAVQSDIKEDVSLKSILEEVEKKYILMLLKNHQWHRTKVAAIMGIDRRTLFRKMKDLGISKLM